MSKLWIARDKDGYLMIFRNKPERTDSLFTPTVDNDNEYRYIDAVFGDPDMFECVTWENSPKELIIKD